VLNVKLAMAVAPPGLPKKSVDGHGAVDALA
jgi:hypothetical protein